VVELCRDLDSMLRISSDAKGLGIFVAYTVAWLENWIEDPRKVLDEIASKSVEMVRSRYSLEKLREDPVVRAYRDFFWRIGIDPTKTRPSSEALVRRVLRGSFPRISIVVDAGNIASIETMVPIGIYDLDKASPPFEIRLSRGGEVFKPIGGKEEVLEAGTPILVDSRGIVMHIYPHRDSIETCVDENTKKIFVLGAGVPKVPRELVEKAVARVVEILTMVGWRWCERIVVVE